MCSNNNDDSQGPWHSVLVPGHEYPFPISLFPCRRLFPSAPSILSGVKFILYTVYYYTVYCILLCLLALMWVPGSVLESSGGCSDPNYEAHFPLRHMLHIQNQCLFFQIREAGLDLGTRFSTPQSGGKSAIATFGGSKAIICSSWCSSSFDLRFRIAFSNLLGPLLIRTILDPPGVTLGLLEAVFGSLVPFGRLVLCFRIDVGFSMFIFELFRCSRLNLSMLPADQALRTVRCAINE